MTENTPKTSPLPAVDVDRLVRRFSVDVGFVDTDRMLTRWKEIAIYENRADAERTVSLNNCEMRIRESVGWWNCQCHGRTPQKCECGSATHFVLSNDQEEQSQPGTRSATQGGK